MMKKILLVLALVITANITFAQQKTNIYLTSGLEFPFSLPSLDVYGGNKGTVLRFAPWINIQESVNFDITNGFGFFAGLTLKNVGFIYKLEDPSTQDPSFAKTEIRKKFRTYNLGVPVGIKLGSFDKFFFYGGYEIEVPMHYKEKTFIDGNKEISREWFSGKTPDFIHSFFLGVEFPYSINLKFKWYITPFFDPKCTDYIPYLPEIQYNKFGVNVYYLSLSFNLFQNSKFYYNRYVQSADGYYY
ncbi:hypothetical protein LJC69_00495 [Bacteroidales bacterium OttesenSCG-928-K22]|nr:hypothetical protein [Bacteroidales bacterium OttesenSCG-928-K22]